MKSDPVRQWRDMVGKRVLVLISGVMEEVQVQEVSPQGRVKLLLASGKSEWLNSGWFQLLEVLS